jgi:hypothetical protein
MKLKKKLIKISIKHIKKTIKSRRTKLNTKIKLNKMSRDEIEKKAKLKKIIKCKINSNKKNETKSIKLQTEGYNRYLKGMARISRA